MPRIKTEQELLDAYEDQAYMMQKVSDKFLTTLGKLVKDIHKQGKAYHKEFGSDIDPEPDDPIFSNPSDEKKWAKMIDGIEKLASKIEEVIYGYAYDYESERHVLLDYIEDYEDEYEEEFPLSYYELQDNIARIEPSPGIDVSDIVDLTIEVAEMGDNWKALFWQIEERYT